MNECLPYFFEMNFFFIFSSSELHNIQLEHWISIIIVIFSRGNLLLDMEITYFLMQIPKSRERGRWKQVFSVFHANTASISLFHCIMRFELEFNLKNIDWFEKQCLALSYMTFLPEHMYICISMNTTHAYQWRRRLYFGFV